MYLQGRVCGYTTVLSTLQQEAWAFVDSLMAQPMSHRPSAHQALHHPFLATASLESCEKQMRLLLPAYSQDRDLLPVVPLDTSLLEQAVSLEVASVPETASASSSWDISALHGSSTMQHHSCSLSGRVPFSRQNRLSCHLLYTIDALVNCCHMYMGTCPVSCFLVHVSSFLVSDESFKFSMLY